MTTIRTHPTWTAERIALLKNRIDAGLSCAEIARDIGVSRNAVIGKANRLGLFRFKRGTAGQMERTRIPKDMRPRIVTQHQIPRALWEKPQFAFVEASEQSAKRCSLIELQHWHCRWPIGDPAAEDFGFCGNKPINGLPYCPSHSRLAYRSGRRDTVVRDCIRPCGRI